MDLSQIKTGDRTIEILHPATGEKLGVRVNLVSIDDERLTKAKRVITDRRLYLEARGKVFKAEEIEENKINLLFAAMTGWEWYAQQATDDTPAIDAPTFHGEIPEFNRRNVNAVLYELAWFNDQVNEAIGETKAFFEPSKQN